MNHIETIIGYVKINGPAYMVLKTQNSCETYLRNLMHVTVVTNLIIIWRYVGAKQIKVKWYV